MADESQDTLSRLLERLERLDKERERLLIAIQVIKGDGEWGDTSQTGSSSAGAQGDDPPATPFVPTASRRQEIRPDSFFGLSQHQAARRYLQSLGHADKLDSIYRAISAGGVEVGGANPLQTLRATLAQNTSVFVRVSPGTFGLREFYPQLGNKAEAAIRGRRGKKAPQKPARRRPKVEGKATKKEKEKAAPPEQEA